VVDTIDAGDLPTVQDCADACVSYKYFDYAPVAGGGFTCWCDNDCPAVANVPGWSTYSIGSNECVFSPTFVPTVSPPTAIPTLVPSVVPTVDPTASPSADPTAVPSLDPTPSPSFTPTTSPTVDPTMTPTADPSMVPTLVPTVTPSLSPTITFTLCLAGYYCDLVVDSIDAGDLPTVQACADACVSYKYFDYAPVAGGGFTCWCDNDCPAVANVPGWSTYSIGSNECVFSPTLYQLSVQRPHLR
jgi:hypothetical protein